MIFDLSRLIFEFLQIDVKLRTHLDYGDIIYDQAFNNSFHQNIESLQYNAALAITGKNLSRTWLRVPSTKTLVQKTMSLFQDI